MYVHGVQACIDEFKLLNRANGVRGLRRFSLRSTEVKEVSDETGETFKCCRGRLN